MNVEELTKQKRQIIHSEIRSQRKLEKELRKISAFMERLTDEYVEKIFTYEGGYHYKFALFITANQDFFKKVENIVADFWDEVSTDVCPLRGYRKFSEYNGKMTSLKFYTYKGEESNSVWKIEITALPDSDCHVSREVTKEEIESYKYKLDRLSNCL